MQLKDALDQAQSVTQAQTKLFFTEYLPPLTATDPMLVEVGHRLEEYCLRPGKALRPLLIACGAALSRDISLEEALALPSAQRLMLSIEFIHKRLLMADDVADRDELRHDKPAFHVQWEQDLAQVDRYKSLSPAMRSHVARSYTEIAGIWLQRLSEQVLLEGFTPSERRTIDQILLTYVYEKTSAGWYLLFDQNFEQISSKTSEEKLLRGLELVTGAYSYQAPLRLGSILGPRSEELEKILLEFGSSTGVLYQLTDDLIGLFGDPATTGKPVGGDIREGKKTLLVQYAYRLGDERDRQQLRRLLGNENITPEEVELVRQIVHRTGAYDQNQAKIKEYAEYSQNCLANLADGEVRQLLTHLVSYLTARQA